MPTSETSASAADPAAAPDAAPDRLGSILRLEAAGKLPADKQASLDRLRAAGRVPQYQIDLDDPSFGAAEQTYGLPPGILPAIAKIESAGKAEAKSPTGVRGLMQVTLGTGAPYGLTETNRTNPYVDLNVGAQVVRDLLKRHGGNVEEALAGYGDPKDTTYAQKVLAAWQRPAEAGEAPKVGSAPAVAPEGSGAQPGPSGLLGTTYYRTFGRAAAYAQALAYKSGLSSMSPEEFSRSRTVDYGLPTPNVPVPEGALATGAAALETAQPGLALLPGARMVSAAIYGLPIAVQYLTDNQNLADTVEAGLGTAFLARDLGKVGGALSRDIQRGRGIFTSPAERAYHEATATAAVATDRVSALRDEALASQALQQTAEQKVTQATTAYDAALKAKLDADAANVPATAPTALPRETVHQVIGIQPGPSRDVLGDTLRAVGEDARDVTPEGMVLEQDGGQGALNIAHKIARTRRQLYRELGAMGDSLGVQSPVASGEGLALKRTAKEVLDLVDEQHLSIGLKERKLASQIATLGNVDESLLQMSKQGFIRDNRDPTGRTFIDLKSGNPWMRPSVDETVPYSKLLELHGRIRNLSLNPTKYPFANGAGRKLFVNIGDQLDEMLRTLEGAHPDLYEKARQARQVVRRVEKPFVEQTLRVVMRGTPAQAAERTLLSGAQKDPTHAKRILMLASEPERESYIAGMWTRLVESATDDAGNVDLGQLEKQWTKYPDDLRNIMASPNSPHATGELLGLFERWHSLVDVASTETTRRATAARAATDLADERLKGLKVAGKELRAARARTDHALKVTAAAFEKAKRAGETAFGKLHERPSQSGGRRLLMGPAFGLLGAFQLLHGNVMGGSIHAALAAAYMRHPLTAAEAMRTAADTLDGERLAATLNAALTGWYGKTIAGQDHEQLPPGYQPFQGGQ